MIKSVTVTNHRDESLEIVLREPEKSGFLITEIDGIGAPTASINTTDLVTSDGAVFNSARLNTRDIELTLKFYGDLSVEKLREKSYRYFPIKKKVRLKFLTDRRECYIDGYVEKNDAVIFSDKAYTKITISCLKPYLYDTDLQITDFSGVSGAFEYAIPSGGSVGYMEFVVNDPEEFSVRSLSTIKTIVYSGEIDTGFVINVKFLNAVTGFRIWDYRTGSVGLQFDSAKIAQVIGHAIAANDSMEISTVKGQKYIEYKSGSNTYNILNCINKDAEWMEFTIGDNILAYTATTGVSGIELSITNPILYQGI